MHQPIRKLIMIRQKLQTIPGGVPTNTHVDRVAGQVPSVASVGSGQALPYLNGAPAAANPLTAGSTTETLPLFSEIPGFHTPAGH